MKILYKEIKILNKIHQEFKRPTGACHSCTCWAPHSWECRSQGCWVPHTGACRSQGCWVHRSWACRSLGCWVRRKGACRSLGCWAFRSWASCRSPERLRLSWADRRRNPPAWGGSRRAGTSWG